MGQEKQAPDTSIQCERHTFTFEHYPPGQHLSAPGASQWSISFTKRSRAETNDGKVYFDDFNLSCDTHRINIFVKTVSIAMVHGSQAWDCILSDNSKELFCDLERDQKLLMDIVGPMARTLSDGIFSMNHRNETSIVHYYHSMNTNVDLIDIIYQQESREVIGFQGDGLRITFHGTQDESLLFSATLASVVTKPQALFIPSINFVAGKLQSAQKCFKVSLAMLKSLQRSFQVMEVRVSTNDGWMSGTATDLVFEPKGSGICGHLSVSLRDGTVIAMSGLSYQPSEDVITGALDTCYIPGLCSLSGTLSNARIMIGPDKTNIYLSAAHIILLQNLMHRSPRLCWPCFPEMSVTFEHLALEYNGKIIMEFLRCQIDVSSSTDGANFFLSCAELASRMISTRNSSITGCFSSGDTIKDFKIQPGEVSIVSDVRTFDWSLLRSEVLSSTNQEAIRKIPNGVIESFSLRVDFQEAMLTTENPHTFPSFQIRQTATSKDLWEYVLKVIFKELPKIYLKTRVMGERATDLTAKAAGRLASSSVPLSAIGSVGALVVTDVLHSSSKLRLPSNLTPENQIDFQYHLVPSFVDILDQLKEYFDKNRVRFGAAAGSTFGIAVGAALYGIPGIIFGNVVGGKLASSALGNVRQDFTTVEETMPVDDVLDGDWVVVDGTGGMSKNGGPTLDDTVAGLQKLLPGHNQTLWSKQECTPSAPLCENTSPMYHGQLIDSDHDDAVPMNQMLPAINVQRGYLTALYRSAFLIIRRRRMEHA